MEWKDLVLPPMAASGLFFTGNASFADELTKYQTDSHVTTAAISATDAQLKVSGKRLRLELDRVYKVLNSNSREVPNHPDSRDITETVSEFIPVGTALNDAEAILRAAGFDVYPAGDPAPSGANTPLLARAIIAPFEHHWLYSYWSKIEIQLLQEDAEKRQVIGSLFATIDLPSS